MLTAGATKTEHQRGESALDISVHVMIGQCIDMIQELQYLAIILQESDDRFIQTGQLLIRLISSRIVGASAIKHITTSVS